MLPFNDLAACETIIGDTADDLAAVIVEPMVGAAGFVIAGSSIGAAARTWLQGSVAAVGALALTIPLRMFVGLDTASQWYAVFISACFGLLVGAVAGRSAGVLRDRPAT